MSDDAVTAAGKMTEALEKVGAKASDAVMIGDSTWDCEAAKTAKVTAIGVLTGGFGESELLDAGAKSVFPSIEDFRSGLEDSVLRV